MWNARSSGNHNPFHNGKRPGMMSGALLFGRQCFRQSGNRLQLQHAVQDRGFSYGVVLFTIGGAAANGAGFIPAAIQDAFDADIIVGRIVGRVELDAGRTCGDMSSAGVHQSVVRRSRSGAFRCLAVSYFGA